MVWSRELGTLFLDGGRWGDRVVSNDITYEGLIVGCVSDSVGYVPQPGGCPAEVLFGPAMFADYDKRARFYRVRRRIVSASCRAGAEGCHQLPRAFGAVLMSTSTVIVAINAQLLRRVRL